jgi:NAD(P)-dependent dehydrogenase (short-subunit alcohol dehydrogenase family)
MSKAILITGAATGFGRDTAETLARAGHTVFASMRDPQGRNREHAEALRKQGIAVVELDVTSDQSVDRALKHVLAQAGRIDVLVNNAGIASAGVTEAFTPDQAKIVLNTNVVGPFRVSRAVLPAMRKQRDGLIINVGSIVGRVTFPFFGIYGASKFAVEALTDSLRYEVSQLGIEVALIQPSAYPTPMYANVQQPADAERAAAYGEVGEIPAAMFKHFTAMFAAADAPNPHDVAEAVAKLVALPRGNRPARTVVGAAFGADAVNAQTAPVQAQVVEALGLGHLAKLAVQSRSASEQRMAEPVLTSVL